MKKIIIATFCAALSLVMFSSTALPAHALGAAVIMVTVIPEVSAFSTAKIRDGAKELRAIRQFGCQTAQNVASAIKNYNLSPNTFFYFISSNYS